MTAQNVKGKIDPKKIKNIKKFNPKYYLLAIAGAAIFLVLILILSIHISGFRYAKYEVGDTVVKFLGKVDSDGNYISGDIYYIDGLTAEYSYDASTDKATIKYSNGDLYIGKSDKFLRHGEGRMEFSDGSIYVGNFDYDKINGTGTFYYVSGDKYTGEFLDGLKHGKGLYVWPSNSEGAFDSYEGEYYKDLRNGQGTYKWADGTVYTGEYVNDQKHGKGTITFANGENGENGDTYTGDFANDFRTGKGTYNFANGDVYVGEFVENKMTGYGKYTWADKTIEPYEGYFENGTVVVVDETK